MLNGGPKEQILENLKDAEDIEQLKGLSREELLSIYCERLVYAIAADKKQPKETAP
jgi:hypothetical protein